MTSAATRGRVVHREAVMGTIVTFDVRTQAPPAAIQQALAEAVDWLHWVDETFSTYKPDSEVNRFDRGELSNRNCSPEFRHVVSICHQMNEGTDGFFDAWAGGHFDPSGVVKGWSIERAADLLTARGLGDHAIDGGGDICVRGAPGAGGNWRVGVRHPLRRDAYCAALSVREGAVATSGTYERGLHVVDPHTGQPATELVSVTVVGADLTSADAYATAALAMGAAAPGWLESLEGFDSQVISPTGRGWSTAGFKCRQVGTLAWPSLGRPAP